MSRADAPLDSTELDEEAVVRRVRERSLAMGYREAARRALAFARRYRAEETAPGGERERACVAQAMAWRAAAHAVGVTGVSHGRSLGERPGLARARQVAETVAPKKSAKSS